jgi:hypothetical protein
MLKLKDFAAELASGPYFEHEDEAPITEPYYMSTLTWVDTEISIRLVRYVH